MIIKKWELLYILLLQAVVSGLRQKALPNELGATSADGSGSLRPFPRLLAGGGAEDETQWTEYFMSVSNLSDVVQTSLEK